MAAGRWWFLALWRSVPGTLALYGAIVVHGVLALWLLYQRRTLRMPAWEATQYALGLMLPALLVAHVVGTRIAWWRLGADDPYPRIVLALWVLVPEYGARQTLTLVLAWLHACIGVHFWLRFRPWYPRVRPWLFAVALLLPTLALLGFVAAGREVSALRQNPRLDRSDAERRPRPDAARGRTAAGDPRGIPDRVSAGAAGRPAGARRPPIAGVASRGADHLPLRPRGGRPRRLHDPGRQPYGRYPACLGVRRPRAVLDLSRADLARPRPAAAGERGRAARARARRRRARRPARLPDPADTRRGGRATAGALGRAGRCVRHGRPAGPRAGAGRALRRPARASRAWPSTSCRTTSCSF